MSNVENEQSGGMWVVALLFRGGTRERRGVALPAIILFYFCMIDYMNGKRECVRPMYVVSRPSRVNVSLVRAGTYVHGVTV